MSSEKSFHNCIINSCTWRGDSYLHIFRPVSNNALFLCDVPYLSICWCWQQDRAEWENKLTFQYQYRYFTSWFLHLVEKLLLMVVVGRLPSLHVIEVLKFMDSDCISGLEPCKYILDLCTVHLGRCPLVFHLAIFAEPVPVGGSVPTLLYFRQPIPICTDSARRSGPYQDFYYISCFL